MGGHATWASGVSIFCSRASPSCASRDVSAGRPNLHVAQQWRGQWHGWGVALTCGTVLSLFSPGEPPYSIRINRELNVTVGCAGLVAAEVAGMVTCHRDQACPSPRPLASLLLPTLFVLHLSSAVFDCDPALSCRWQGPWEKSKSTPLGLSPPRQGMKAGQLASQRSHVC